MTSPRRSISIIAAGLSCAGEIPYIFSERGPKDSVHFRKDFSGPVSGKPCRREYLHELLLLIPEAVRVWEKNIGGGILKTTYDFQVTKQDRDVLWYVPNEVGGVTMMKPEDY